MNADFIVKMWPKAAHPAAEMAAALNAIFAEFDISTQARRAGFLSQFAYETAGFSALEENLNHSASGLRRVFHRRLYLWAEKECAGANPVNKPKIIPLVEKRSLELAHKPEAIAEFVYGGRFGNRPEGAGDGWKFRGRGWPHLTFHDNYLDAGNALGLDLVAHPDLAKELPHCARVAGWFWHNKGCNAFADRRDITGLTKVINGGKNGLPERIGLWSRLSSMEIPS